MRKLQEQEAQHVLPAHADRRKRWAYRIALAALVVVGVLARLVVWPEVMTPAGLRLTGDGDALYHALRAERMLHGSAAGWWFDPFLDFPHGAAILWPPGFTGLLAGAAGLVYGRGATREQLELAIMWVPVLLSVPMLLLTAELARRWFGRPVALVATFLAGVLMVTAQPGLLGHTDHHVAEILIFLALVLAFDDACRRRAGRWAIARFGVLLAIAPWFWQGAVLYPAIFATIVTVLFVLRPDGREEAGTAAEILGVGAALGAVLLFASVVWVSPPGLWRPERLSSISTFHAALLAAVAAYGGLLRAAGRRPALDRSFARVGAVIVSAAIPLGLVSLAYSGPIAHGLSSAAATDPMWANIAEDQPIVFGGLSTFKHDGTVLAYLYGPCVIAPLLALPALVRSWRERRARWAVVLAAVPTFLFLLATARSIRFMTYFGPFAALSSAVVVVALARLCGARSRLAGAALGAAALVGFSYPVVPFAHTSFAAADEEVVELFRWLGRNHGPELRSVLCAFEHGHTVQYYAGLPAIVTPFGTDVGPGGLRDFAAFAYANTPAEAEAVLHRRRVGYLLLDQPAATVSVLSRFAAPGHRHLVTETRDPILGRVVNASPEYEQGMVSWLFDFDGVPEQFVDAPALGAYRLVYETPYVEKLPRKLFEVVDGAILRVPAREGALVRARARVETRTSRRFVWFTVGKGGPGGYAELRVPYATGANGTTRASVYEVETPGGRTTVSVPGFAVEEGRVVEVK